MSHERNIKLLNDRRIVYKRDPVDDVPTHQTDKYMFFEQGTYECYTLFASKAKITTYKSLKWHLLTLWYLNPDIDQDEFMQIAEIISIKEQGFTSFTIHIDLLRKMVYEVSMLDLDEPPKNKLRKVIFKYGCGLTKEEKLSIVKVRRRCIHVIIVSYSLQLHFLHLYYYLYMEQMYVLQDQ
jgi:hypothetical protein